MSGRATLTTVPSRKVSPEPVTATASSQRPGALSKARPGTRSVAVGEARRGTLLVGTPPYFVSEFGQQGGDRLALFVGRRLLALLRFLRLFVGLDCVLFQHLLELLCAGLFQGRQRRILVRPLDQATVSHQRRRERFQRPLEASSLPLARGVFAEGGVVTGEVVVSATRDVRLGLRVAVDQV